MKKMLLSILLVGLILFTGCENKEQTINDAMKEYTTDYYETYIKGKNLGIDIPEITVANLKAALERDYDMKKLEDCTDSSYATLILDNDENIKSIELHMNCK